MKRLFLIALLSIVCGINNSSLYDKELVAQSYYESMLYDDAIIIYEEILETKKNVFGPTNINLLDTIKKLYELYLLKNNTSQALFYLQEHINIQSSYIIQQQKIYTDPLLNLKEIYTNQKNPDLFLKLIVY